MLIEAATPSFSDDTESLPYSGPLGLPGAIPFEWEEAPGLPKSPARDYGAIPESPSRDYRSQPESPAREYRAIPKSPARDYSAHEPSKLMLHEHEGLHLEETASDMFFRNRKDSEFSRCDSNSYVRPGTVPFKWEASPGKPMMKEAPHSESPRLQPPPALRAIYCNNRPAFPKSPQERFAGKVKSIIAAGRVSVPLSVSQCAGGQFLHMIDRKPAKWNSSSISSPQSSVTLASYRSSFTSSHCSSNPGDDLHRDSIDSMRSYGGDNNSPISTLDYPESPPFSILTPHQDLATEKTAPKCAARQISQLAHCLVTLSEMSQELPMVKEEDEEDFEDFEAAAISGTMYSAESPGSVGYYESSKSTHGQSKSGPIPSSRIQRTPAARNRRRRSDTDWPEEFQEGPEVEQLQGVDDGMWAYSPRRSAIVSGRTEMLNQYQHQGMNPRGASRYSGELLTRHCPASRSPHDDSFSDHNNFSGNRKTDRILRSGPLTPTGCYDHGFSKSVQGSVYVGDKASNVDCGIEISGPLGTVHHYFDPDVYELPRHKTISCLPFRQLYKAFSSNYGFER